MPIDFGRKDRRDVTAHTSLAPLACAPFPNSADGLLSFSPTHPCDRHSLLSSIARIIAEEKIEEFLPRIEHHGKISIAASKIIILCVALERVRRRFQHNAEVMPRCAVVGGFHRANLRRGQVHFGRLRMRPRADARRLEMIPAVKCAILALPCALNPPAAADPIIILATRIIRLEMKKVG